MFLDGVYTANITLGDHVLLDTSSADLWVDHAPETLIGFTDKGIAMTFEYAFSNGSLLVDGTVATAKLNFGTYEVKEQAFLDIHDDGEEFLKLMGVNGILGLGLDRIHSAIDTTVKETEGADATWGSPLLRNIFAQSHDADNYVSLDLARTEDGEDIQGGTITIGDFEDGYEAVLDQSRISVYPEDAKRWTIVIQGINVDGKDIALKSDFPVEGAVALVSVDFASPGGYVPESVLHDIYGSIDGVAKYDDGESLRYIVPCSAAPNVTYSIGGAQYPLHPLDLSRFWNERPQALQSNTVCISSLKSLKQPQEDHDLCLGGAFLRNVYTVFDFGDKEGDKMGTPYVQFLSEHDLDKAHQDFATHRNMDGKPEELKPEEALERLESEDSNSPGTVTLTPIPHPSALLTRTASGSARPTASGTSRGGKNAKEADLDNTNVLSASDSSSSSSEGTFAKWAPAVLGLLGANLLVMLVLLVLGVLNYIKRNGSGGGKSGSGRGSPMSAPKAIPHYILGSKKRDSSSSYQPVGRPSFVERRDSEVIFDSEASAIPAPPGIAVNDRYDPYDAPSRSRTPIVPPPPPPPPPGLSSNTAYDPNRSNTTATTSSSYSQDSLSTVHAPHRH
ncbi:aspartic peptidase domain-containing protein [Coprinopsis sp. MPI-PUGE-AT-0042]|nr:aspartic peptidase domain-containing protein [Coprinopsis sp. MPI-PUGE-AT-0042]